MARATKEEAQETRSRILDAAQDVFHARGVSHTSLADIATAAAVTRGAIYWHFKNKSDLFDAMCERVRLPMEAMLDAAPDQRDADPLGHFLKGATWVMQDVVHNPRSRKVIDIVFNKCEIADRDDPILVRQRECFMDGMTRFKQVMRSAVACGQLPAGFNCRLGAVLVHATLTGLMQDWLFAPESFDLALHADKLLSACIHSLRTAPSLQNASAAEQGEA